jgi:hypothetical protein
MQRTGQRVVCDDDGHEETCTDAVIRENACQRIDHFGLTLTEAKQILTTLQQRLVAQGPRPLSRPVPSMSPVAWRSGSKAIRRCSRAVEST